MKPRIQELLISLQEKGVRVILTQDSDEYWHLILDKQYRGFWTEAGIANVLGQLFNPTYGAKWFTSQGLPVPVR